ncbi:lipopolysaccharide assembly LapA domain-containing protein [uncultured Mycolicibacterium sp.]|uniref:LapA family protein n=1 Tax=uncultured Mycolicibacterium sp. TaxID=2320817 RepID=UPI0026141530|nr:lipopolysaccharide assembly protein LapA domain-containing protein [uncultured Mycolicibacterium sp.]
MTSDAYGQPAPGPEDSGAAPEDLDTAPGSATQVPDEGLKRTRAAALWSALVGGFLVLIVLLIFIAQNTVSAQFRFLGWQWSLPLGVAILGSAVCGGLLTVAVGTVRILQLRRAARRNARR